MDAIKIVKNTQDRGGTMKEEILICCPRCKSLRKINLEKFAIKCDNCEAPIKIRVKDMKQSG